MEQVAFESVRKVFRHRPALFNLVGSERGGETVALEGLSLSVMSGEVVALLGPNGSGKTTTLKLISTLFLPDAGSVRVQGFDSRSAETEVRRRVGIAVATERSFFPRLSARENLEFFAALDEVPRRERQTRIESVLQETGLEEQSETLAAKFSSGMYQRLGLARALVKRPEVLLLDEPTRSLDAAATEQFWRVMSGVAQKGTCILLATHNFAEAAEVAHRILILHRGKLLADRRFHREESAEELRSFYLRMTEDRGVHEVGPPHHLQRTGS